MGAGLAILIAAVLAAGIVATGRWRFVFYPFRLRRRNLDIDRIGLLVPPADKPRVERIFESFATGFNSMICRPNFGAAVCECDRLGEFERPFAHEGLALGYTLRHLGRFEPIEFETDLVHPRSEFRYLYYVGLGFWWGIRNVAPRRVALNFENLDPLHKYLCFDGYGFQRAFFDFPNHRPGNSPLDSFTGYARHAAYQGVGRALWFRFMARPDLLIAEIQTLGEFACDAAAGVGLASVFVNTDRLDVVRDLAVRMPEAWRPHFHLGLCFGLKARSITNVEQYDIQLSRVEPAVREAIVASVAACDRIERQVRLGDPGNDGYRRWRGQVTEWMLRHIEYPLTSVREEASSLEPTASV